eukprot:364939-Chlamydomonas_euryale.AAC.8
MLYSLLSVCRVQFAASLQSAVCRVQFAEYMYSRLATDKAPCGHNWNKDDGWPEQPPACRAASQPALLWCEGAAPGHETERRMAGEQHRFLAHDSAMGPPNARRAARNSTAGGPHPGTRPRLGSCRLRVSPGRCRLMCKRVLKLGQRRVTRSSHKGRQLSVQAGHGTCSRRISTIPRGGGPARRDHPPVQGRLALQESRVLPIGRKNCPHAPACLVGSGQSRSAHGLPSASMLMGAGTCTSQRCCTSTDAPVVRPSARTTACAAKHHQKAWPRQLQRRSCVPTMSWPPAPCTSLTGRRQRPSNRLLSYRRSPHRSRRAVACAPTAFRTSAPAGGNLPLCAAAAQTNWQYRRRCVRATLQHCRAVANQTVRPSARRSGALGRHARRWRTAGACPPTCCQTAGRGVRSGRQRTVPASPCTACCASPLVTATGNTGCGRSAGGGGHWLRPTTPTSPRSWPPGHAGQAGPWSRPTAKSGATFCPSL